MTPTQLKAITKAVIRRAQRQGSVSPDDIRDELKQAGQSKTHWKDIIAEARDMLTFLDGAYHYVPPDPSIQEEHRHQQEVQRVLRRLIRKHRHSSDQMDRRREGRVDFIQPVTLQTEDGRSFALLSRDISPTGIRLIGSRGFLGQKVRVTLPTDPEEGPASFWVRVLWTCTVGDQLFENGGSFLEIAAAVEGHAQNGVLVG